MPPTGTMGIPLAPVSLRVMGRSFCSGLRVFDRRRTAIWRPAGWGPRGFWCTTEVSVRVGGWLVAVVRMGVHAGL